MPLLSFFGAIIDDFYWYFYLPLLSLIFYFDIAMMPLIISLRWYIFAADIFYYALFHYYYWLFHYVFSFIDYALILLIFIYFHFLADAITLYWYWYFCLFSSCFTMSLMPMIFIIIYAYFRHWLSHYWYYALFIFLLMPMIIFLAFLRFRCRVYFQLSDYCLLFAMMLHYDACVYAFSPMLAIWLRSLLFFLSIFLIYFAAFAGLLRFSPPSPLLRCHIRLFFSRFYISLARFLIAPLSRLIDFFSSFSDFLRCFCWFHFMLIRHWYWCLLFVMLWLFSLYWYYFLYADDFIFLFHHFFLIILLSCHIDYFLAARAFRWCRFCCQMLRGCHAFDALLRWLFFYFFRRFFFFFRLPWWCRHFASLFFDFFSIFFDLRCRWLFRRFHAFSSILSSLSSPDAFFRFCFRFSHFRHFLIISCWYFISTFPFRHAARFRHIFFCHAFDIYSRFMMFFRYFMLPFDAIRCRHERAPCVFLLIFDMRYVFAADVFLSDCLLFITPLRHAEFAIAAFFADDYFADIFIDIFFHFRWLFSPTLFAMILMLIFIVALMPSCWCHFSPY